MQQIIQPSSTQNRDYESSRNCKSTYVKDKSGAQKSPPTTRDLSKKTEYERTMHTRNSIDSLPTEQMLLPTLPVVLKKENQKIVFNSLLDHGSTNVRILPPN